MHSKQNMTHFRLLLLLFVAILLLAACGPEEATAPIEPAEIHWLTFDTNNQAEVVVMKKYQETQPQITFKRDGRFRGGFFGGFLPDPPPDLLSATADYDYLQAIRQEQVADLSELWDQAELADKIPQNVRSLIELDGNPYMTPLAINWTAIYYNKEVFAEAGLQPPKTWDEFINVCEQLILNGEIPLVITGNRSYTFMLWFDMLNLRINGAQFHRDLLDGKERWDDARVYEVFNRWQFLFQQNYFVDNPQYLNDLAASNSLIRDDKGMLRGPKAAMMLIDSRTVGEMPAKFREELDFFSFPTIDPSIPAAESGTVIGYVIPRAADHTAQAVDFLNFMNSAESQGLLLAPNSSGSAAFVPVRSDFNSENESAEMKRAIDTLQGAPQLAPQGYIWMPREMWIGFNNGYTRFLRNKEYDIPQFLEALQKAQDDAKKIGAYQE